MENLDSFAINRQQPKSALKGKQPVELSTSSSKPLSAASTPGRPLASRSTVVTAKTPSTAHGKKDPVEVAATPRDVGSECSLSSTPMVMSDFYYTHENKYMMSMNK